MDEAEASVASHSQSHRVAITWHQKLGHIKQHRQKFKTSNSRSVSKEEIKRQFTIASSLTEWSGRGGWVCNLLKREPCELKTDRWRCVTEKKDGKLFNLIYWKSLCKGRYSLVGNVKLPIKNTPPPPTTPHPILYPAAPKLSSVDTVVLMKHKFKKMKKCLIKDVVNERTEVSSLSTTYSDRERKVQVQFQEFCYGEQHCRLILTDEESINSSESMLIPSLHVLKKAMQGSRNWKLFNKNKNIGGIYCLLPGGRKLIGNKWVYKIKRNGDDQVERYRARLVVKGYVQKRESISTRVFCSCGPE
ncbi:gag-pol polyprotein [Tanacetum coccineum]